MSTNKPSIGLVDFEITPRYCDKNLFKCPLLYLELVCKIYILHVGYIESMLKSQNAKIHVL